MSNENEISHEAANIDPEFPIVITLRRPLKWGSETITEAVIEKELEGADLIYAQNALVGKEGTPRSGDYNLCLMSRATNLSEPQIKALSARDFNRILSEVQAFLPDGLETLS